MTEALNRAPTGDSARGPGVDETPGPHPLTRRRPESSTSAHATSQASWFRFPRFSKSADTNRGATLSMTLDGMQTRLDGPAAGALNIDVTLACLCHAPHDLDVFPRLRELLDQLPRLLTKSLVDHTQLTQVPVGFVALTHFVPKLRRDVAMAGLELAVGFPHLVELPFQTALGRPGFAERPLTFFPLGAELLSLLLKLLHCVGHVDLDGEHIRFGHCADILHRSPLFLAGRLGGSAREQ